MKYLYILVANILLNSTAVSLSHANGIIKCNSLYQDPVPYDSLKTVLEKIYDTDQGIREKVSSGKGDVGKLFFQMQQIDSLNQVQVKHILNQYGWLPQSKIGEKAADALFYVVQHAETDLIKKYLPALKKLADKKEAKTTHAAMMEDRLLMYEGKKQIYGTQASSSRTAGMFLYGLSKTLKK